MRWFLGLVLVIALVTGAAYGVGRFLLPNTLEVTRTTVVERPRASVFAMANDLRIAREWSPFYAMDPDADYAYSGEGPGAGQTMRWSSTVREVGAGRISIVDSIENGEVDTIIEHGDVTLNSSLVLRPQSEGTAVAWSVAAECTEGWINVPCRYMNLILRGRIQGYLDSGLARLKTLAEQLPNVNFEGLEIVQAPVEAENVLFVDVSIATPSPTWQDRASAEADGVNALNNFIASTGGQVTRGDTLVRIFSPPSGSSGVLNFSVGYPYTGPAPLRLVGVRVGETPGGPALSVEFEGRRSQIPVIYQRIDAYMQAHRIAARDGAPRWEVVQEVQPAAPDGQNADDPVERTVIYFPVQ